MYVCFIRIKLKLKLKLKFIIKKKKKKSLNDKILDKISNSSACTEFSISSFQKDDISSAISSSIDRATKYSLFTNLWQLISTDNLAIIRHSIASVSDIVNIYTKKKLHKNKRHIFAILYTSNVSATYSSACFVTIRIAIFYFFFFFLKKENR